MKDAEGIATSVIALIVVLAVVAGAGAYLLVTGAGEPSSDGAGENKPPGENQPPSGPTSGPYFHQVYSATSSDGINWVTDNTLLFNHASVPGAVYFDNKLYVYFVNAADWEHEKLSVGVSEDQGTTFTTHDVQISGSNSPYPVDPNPIIDNGKIRLTYLGNFGQVSQGVAGNIVTATSTDGINFTEEAVIYTGEAFDPDLFYHDVSGEWVMFFGNMTGNLIRATASSPTATFAVDQSFSWTAGGITSTYKIEDKYYTYYSGNGISVAEYSGGTLTNITADILNYQGLNADPTVAIFEPNDYKMFFKTQVAQQG